MTLVEERPSDQLLQEAMAAYREGRFSQAEVCCRQILEKEPRHIGGMQVLAAVAGQFGVPKRGIEVVGKIIELEPGNADAQIQLAKLLRQDRRDDEAIEALRKAIELDQANASAYNDLGLIYLERDDFEQALGLFDQATVLNPDLAIAHYNKGILFERRGAQADAIAAFKSAAAADVNFVEAYAKLGNLLLINNEHAQAMEMLRKVIAIKPDSGLAWICRAKILVEEGQTAAAESAVRETIAREPQNSDAHALLGGILMELGRFDDASAEADLAIALNRQQVGAYDQLVNARKLKDRDRPLLAQMNWVLEHSELSEHGRSEISFALGKAHDDFGEYQQAIRHFDEANRLKHLHISFNHEGNAKTVDRQIAAFNKDYFERNASLGSTWDGPVLILGMPRSGSTLVEQILSNHQGVAPGGELTFWAEQFSTFRMDQGRRVDPHWVEATAASYRTLLDGIAPGARHITDKLPRNFNAIALIHVVFPRARIIHCMRHPVDTCLSNYFQNFARRIDFAYDRRDLVLYYQQYQRLMAHWRSVLQPDCMLEIQYEQLVADPEPVTRRMIEFCGLEWDDACLHHERNTRPVRTASLWQARQPVYRSSVSRWQNYRPWLGELEELLTDAERNMPFRAAIDADRDEERSACSDE